MYETKLSFPAQPKLCIVESSKRKQIRSLYPAIRIFERYDSMKRFAFENNNI